MSFLKDFRAFAVKGNVVELAVAVVIGGAFGKIVTALVGDLIMPLVSALLPADADWRTWTVTPLNLKLGAFIGAVVDFLIIALVLFLVVKKVLGRWQDAPPPPSTKKCPECLELIPLEARRCRACTSPQSA